MSTNINDTDRSAAMTAYMTAWGASSHLLVYTGTIPSKTASPTGTLLATFALAATPGTVSTGVLTVTPPSNVTAAAGGSPGYYRIIDGSTDDGTHTRFQGSAGVGLGDLDFTSTVASGGSVGITSLGFTEGNN